MDPDANSQKSNDTEFGLTKKKSFVVFGAIGFVLIVIGVLMARMEMTVRSTGTVYAEGQRYVYAGTDGVLREHHAGIGEVVEAGAPLVSMDTLGVEREISSFRREIEEVEGLLEENELAHRELDVRPLPAEVASADQRLELISVIRQINEDIMASLQQLEAVRAIRSLELNRQRLAVINSELAGLGAEVYSRWKKDGLAEIERRKLEIAAGRLENRKTALQRELELLERERDTYTVRAPVDGRILDIHKRYEGMAAKEGDLLVTMAPENLSYRIKTYVEQRNVDLLQPGLEVRMESGVFDSVLEGYLYGRVLNVVEAARGAESGTDWESPRFEVTIKVTDTPYPLVLGSTVDVRLIIGQRNILELLTGRPAGGRGGGSEGEDR